MSVFCGKILTIDVEFEDETYLMKEYTDGFVFTSEMIEGLVEKDVDLIPKFGEFSDNEPLDIPTMTTDFIKEHGFPRPDGYIFKDENGNEILTSKIILKKKKKEVTYPKTYEECCEIMDCAVHPYITANEPGIVSYYEDDLNRGVLSLRKLLICRDAYWKIAGEEMGLGKPWEPDWREKRYIIYRNQDDIIGGFRIAGEVEHHIFEFPTAEMRDAFKENFDPDIEICKELL